MTADSVAINEVKLPKEDINTQEASVITVPNLSIGHSEALRIKLFTACDLVSIYYGNRFYCLSTRESQRDAASVLSERIRDLGEVREDKTTFSNLDEKVRERLLVELFRHVASKAKFFAIYDRVFFQAGADVDPFSTPSFELSVKELQDCYGYFINPTRLSMTNCTRLADRLREGDRLIRLCSKRFDCSVFVEEGRCKYSYPTYIGLLSQFIRRDSEEFTTELDDLYSNYDECPSLDNGDFWILHVKRTKDAKRERSLPSFLAFRELTKAEQRLFGIEKEFRDKSLSSPAVRYLHTKNIIDEVFKNDSMNINDLSLRARPEIGSFQQIPQEGLVVGLEEPLLQFDPINEHLCSVEPSSLFFKGVYDALSVYRPFGTIKPYVIVPRDTNRAMNQLLSWLSSGRNYTDREGRQKVDFVGLNHRFSKFNCKFLAPQENEYFYADTEDTFIEAAEAIVNQWNNDDERVVLVVLPEAVDDDGQEGRYGEYARPFSLYYRLKKIFVENGIPCQMIEKDTFSRMDRYVLQNLLVNIYSKMGGRPWSLHSPLSDVNAFIGIGFGLNPKETEKHVYIGVANVFDSHGEWLDICSDHKDITDQERDSFFGYEAFTERSASYKLSEAMARKITEDALRRFKDTNPHIGYPRNVVVHKNGGLFQCEVKGITEALRVLEQSGAAFEKIGLLSIIQDHNYRLFGNEESFDRGYRVIKDRPPRRGITYFLKEDEALLCTTGKFYGERPGGMKLVYSGLGTPRPLLLRNHKINPKNYELPELQLYPFIDLIGQVFGLSKIHWGSLRTDIHLPVTSMYSNRVAKVISKSGIRTIPRPATKRPWFL
jgi:hypothetical protein